ncbi:alpha/beta fold hydrolase [Nakamurella sp. YIM 132084]|uniref:Alpha/beta fold hydrolase n=2 Tax=Nakamurella leprariae TaxID=2803911 RepID=A0A938Y6D4_9ACTN|nr:alpha/beta fold hydrolase [Nakamurella leprariae]
MVQAPAAVDAVVLALHGGSEDTSTRSTRWWHPGLLRMDVLAGHLAADAPRTAVFVLRFAVAAWNADGDGVVRDLRWALDLVGRRFPGRPVVLVGHSLGARVAVRSAAGTDGPGQVRGLVLLAPWLPDDPVALAVPVVVLSGARDRTVPREQVLRWVDAARTAGTPISAREDPTGDHAMLRNAGRWHRDTAAAVRRLLTDDD